MRPAGRTTIRGIKIDSPYCFNINTRCYTISALLDPLFTNISVYYAKILLI